MKEENITYLQLKNRYKILKKEKKKEYDLFVIESILKHKDTKTLWTTFNKFRKKAKPNQCPIQPSAWEVFYKSLYSEPVSDNSTFFGVLNPILDTQIRQSEILQSITSTKSGKAPGPDQISMEFFKNLPQNAFLYLTCLFNKILEQEHIPRSWTNIYMFMLHKKGDKENPINYRGIALLNSILKIFTKILLGRLLIWEEEVQLLPECQSGFRSNRGCEDNIFALSSLTHLQIRLPKPTKVFAAFIDFKRAFDSIPQAKLWSKLNNMGFSPKYIRILKSLYDNIFFKVKAGNSLTNSIKLTEGRKL